MKESTQQSIVDNLEINKAIQWTAVEESTQLFTVDSCEGIYTAIYSRQL